MVDSEINLFTGNVPMRAARIITLLSSFFTGFVQADLTIRFDAVSPDYKKPLHQVLIKQNFVRINQLSGKQPDIMLDSSTGDIVQLHFASKSYFRTNTKSINQYVSLYNQNKDLMKGLITQGIQHLNPQKQLKIQQMLENYNKKSSSPGSISFKDTGETDTILGVQCRIFTMLDQGHRAADVCLASYQQLELSPTDVKSFEKLKLMVQEFKNSSPEHRNMLTIMANGLENLHGVPLKIIRYRADGKINSMVQAGAISFRQIPRLTYQIPGNYQQKLTPIL